MRSERSTGRTIRRAARCTGSSRPAGFGRKLRDHTPASRDYGNAKQATGTRRSHPDRLPQAASALRVRQMTWSGARRSDGLWLSPPAVALPMQSMGRESAEGGSHECHDPTLERVTGEEEGEDPAPANAATHAAKRV